MWQEYLVTVIVEVNGVEIELKKDILTKSIDGVFKVMKQEKRFVEEQLPTATLKEMKWRELK